MDLQEIHEILVTDYAHKLADWKNGAIVSYIENQFKAIKSKGLDPTDFELVEIRGNIEMQDNGDAKIVNKFQIRKKQ